MVNGIWFDYARRFSQLFQPSIGLGRRGWTFRTGMTWTKNFEMHQRRPVGSMPSPPASLHQLQSFLQPKPSAPTFTS